MAEFPRPVTAVTRISSEPRPTSREAWRDPEKLYDNDPESAVSVPTVINDGDEPVAMESEVFDKDGSVRVQQRQVAREQPQGCWAQCMLGIRSIWMTKHTEDTKHNRELYIRTTLRELLIYILFIIVLCIVTFAMTSSTMYYYTKVMSELFLDSQTPQFHKTFRGITQMDDFWAYAEGPMLDGVYWEQWYNRRNVTEDERFIFYENKLLGVPRIRMVKVQNDSCDVPDAFRREIKECFDAYSSTAEDKSPFGPQNGTAYV